MPVWVHEWLIAPVALAWAAVHAWRALGGRDAAVELLVLITYGFALEAVTMRVFASHVYDASWVLAPLGVPVAVAVVWAALILSTRAVAARLGCRRPWSRAAGSAALAVTLDQLVEPVAVRLGFWAWTPPGPWLGVPVGNFVGWTVIVGAYTFGAETWGGRGLGRRLALMGAALASLVGVGLVWTATGAEARFEGPAAWLAWLCAPLAVAVLSLRPAAVAPGAGTTPAERLAATRGVWPEAVLLLLVAAFVFDAATLAEPALRLVAGVAAGTLGTACVVSGWTGATAAT